MSGWHFLHSGTTNQTTTTCFEIYSWPNFPEANCWASLSDETSWGQGFAYSNLAGAPNVTATITFAREVISGDLIVTTVMDRYRSFGVPNDETVTVERRIQVLDTDSAWQVIWQIDVPNSPGVSHPGTYPADNTTWTWDTTGDPNSITHTFDATEADSDGVATIINLSGHFDIRYAPGGKDASPVWGSAELVSTAVHPINMTATWEEFGG